MSVKEEYEKWRLCTSKEREEVQDEDGEKVKRGDDVGSDAKVGCMQADESDEMDRLDDFPGYSILQSAGAAPSDVITIVFTSGSTG